MAQVTGWDVGGAHLKASLIEDGVVREVVQLPSLIWTDLGDAEKALQQAKATFGGSPIHAVTMTGELAEYFGSRVEGVKRLSGLIADAFPNEEVRIFAGRSGFVSPDSAADHSDDIASANWYATAAVVARTRQEAILVDIGSSTCDIIPVFGGEVSAAGYSDAERLQTGELIYSAAVRTPVMAVVDEVPFEGSWQGLMAERFAVMADVYRILGTLPEDADLFPAVDGREKDVPGSRARLARNLGRDALDHADWQWDAVARFMADVQTDRFSKNVSRSLSRFAFSADAPIVGAGAGRFIAEEIARRMQRPFVDFSSLVKSDMALKKKISTCAPAVAVGLLS